MSPSSAPPPPKSRCSMRQVSPDIEHGYPRLQDLTWEDSGLQDTLKHPTGFGSAQDAPIDCKHQKQVGATCGMAAVNNLITNCHEPGVSTEYMMEISNRLGMAETAIRDGAVSVEEAGEDCNVAELYATSVGGHFDVQTLQTAFDEAGFNMWYVSQQRLQKPSTLFESEDETELAGYVVHRKDPLNPRQDHWFVLRRHGDKQKGQFLLQDSLYDKIFELTTVEAHQLLLSMPPGALFIVSKRQKDSE